MIQIPVSFDYEGKTYSGYLQADAEYSSKYVLMIDDKERGQLFLIDVDEAQFLSNNGEFATITNILGESVAAADYFEECIAAWYESTYE